MAEIRRFLALRHLRAEPTAHVLLFKRGRRRKSGPGLSFWFSPLGASIAEVPLEDRELPFLIQARSADFQPVNVNGAVTFRVIDPELLAQRVDFAIDARTGQYRSEPLDKLSGVVVQLAHQLAVGFLARAPLAELLAQGVDVVRDAIQRGLSDDVGLASLGIAIVATRVAALRPSSELEKALQMPTRERIQQAADEATFGRRALAVEKERAIQENELATQIELARREEQLIAQRGLNDKKRAIDESEARRIGAEARARDSRLSSHAEADGVRVLEEAQVNAERDRVAIYRDLPPHALLGLAAHQLAGKLETIEHLSVSPDMLGDLLQRVLGAQARRLEDSAAMGE